mmetsp:Transcript_124204/g.345747  ORF Transcript_124204/g.345747 Transcript_124204/m.345747 type:complete len:109 (-) Transcript_124204:1193-1519(-)
MRAKLGMRLGHKAPPVSPTTRWPPGGSVCAIASWVPGASELLLLDGRIARASPTRAMGLRDDEAGEAERTEAASRFSVSAELAVESTLRSMMRTGPLKASWVVVVMPR